MLVKFYIYKDIQLNLIQYRYFLNTSRSGAGFIGEFVSTLKGCLFEYLTSASSTSWWQGVLGGSNEFVIKTSSNGLTVKSNDSAVLSGSLTQDSDASLHDDVEDVGLIDCMNMLETLLLKHTPGTIWNMEING